MSSQDSSTVTESRTSLLLNYKSQMCKVCEYLLTPHQQDKKAVRAYNSACTRHLLLHGWRKLTGTDDTWEKVDHYA